MRPGAELAAMGHGAPTAAPVNGTAAAHTSWQSPVPYLFGGLAAMLGLIAFALLILACSYWKLSGYLDGPGDQAGRQARGADDEEKGSAAGAARLAVGFLEHVVVIMAGEETPTFLATPATSRAVVELGAAAAVSPCGDGEGCSEEGVKRKKKVEENCEESSQPQSQPQLGGHSTDADAVAGEVSRSHESSSTTTQQETSQ